MKKSFFSLTILTVVTLFLVGFFVFGGLQEKERNIKIQEEVSALEKEANKISAFNKKLNERISYFQTAHFQEWEAKKKLNMKVEDEEVVVLNSQNIFNNNSVEEDKVEEKKENNLPDQTPNYEKWWNYFFQSR